MPPATNPPAPDRPLELRLSPSPGTCPLSTLRAGEIGFVTEIMLDAHRAARLMDLGFVRGARVRFVRWAPCGDPAQIEILDGHFAIRRADAAGIIVQRARTPAP